MIHPEDDYYSLHRFSYPSLGLITGYSVNKENIGWAGIQYWTSPIWACTIYR